MPLFGRNNKSVTANSTTTAESTTGQPILSGGNARWGADATIHTGEPNTHFGNTSAGSRASIDATLWQNDTPSAFITNMAIGCFGVSAAEMSNNTVNGVPDQPQHAGWVIRRAGTGGIAAVAANTTGSSGFVSGESVTISNGGSNATLLAVANAGGNLTGFTVQSSGSGWVNTAMCVNAFAREAYVSAITVTPPKYVTSVTVVAANGFNNNSILTFTAVNSQTQYVAGVSANLSTNSIGGITAVTMANGGFFATATVAANITVTVANVGGGAVQGNSVVTSFTPVLASAAANGYVNGSIITYTDTVGATPPGGMISATSAALVTNSIGGNTTTVAVATNGLFPHGTVPANLTITITLPAGNTTANTLPWPFVPTMSNSTGGSIGTITLGGRAGRVHTETLVALGSLGAQTSAYGTPAIANTSQTYYPG